MALRNAPKRIRGAVQLLAVFVAIPFIGLIPVSAQESGEGASSAPAEESSADEPIELDGGLLPWETDDADPTVLPSRPLSSPREALKAVGEEELLAAFVDGEPIDNELAALFRLLFRLPRFGPASIEQFAKRSGDVSVSEIGTAPDTYRFEMLPLKGRVRHVERVALRARDAELFEYDHYYVVEMQANGAANLLTVFARRVPQAWKMDEPMDEPVSLFGLFLKLGPSANEDQPSPLVFAADRIAWHPDHENDVLGIEKSHVFLAGLGMDVGLFDDVRTRNQRGLDKEDSECFYQLLAAIGRSKQEELWRQTKTEFDLRPVISEPAKQHGRMMVIEGTVRRITKIPLDAHESERYGFDHYYQLDVLIPLENERVKLGKDEPGKPAPEFINNFPVQVCVRRLPAGMSEGEDLNEQVRLPCVYFKLWSYTSEYIARFDQNKRQISPLLVALEPEIVEYDYSLSVYISLVAVSVFAVAIGGIWFAVWLYGRSDKKFERETLRRQFEVESGKSLDEMGIESQDGPDFSGLP